MVNHLMLVNDKKLSVGNPTNLTFVRLQALYSQREDCVREREATKDQIVYNKEKKMTRTLESKVFLHVQEMQQHYVSVSK